MVLPLVLGGIGAGLGLWGAKKGADAHGRAAAGIDRMRREFGGDYRMANQRMGASRNMFQSAIEGYDPEAYANRALSGQIPMLNDALAGNQARNRASLNSRGLLRSPIGNDRLMRDYNRQLANTVNSTAMQYGQMAGQRTGMFGQLYGMDANQRNASMGAYAGMGMQHANAIAGQGDAWAQALGGIGGGLMGMGGSMYQYGG